MALEITEQVATALDGVLVVDKPGGWTSHDVVAKLRRLLRVQKVGHTGTLDPAATGVLVLCVGRATRIAEYLMATDKLYRATLRLGVTTDTQDATGIVTKSHHGPLPDEKTIRTAMATFVGMTHQVPPMYSAVKIKGVRLYRAARAGHTVPRIGRDCRIDQLTVHSVKGGSTAIDRADPVPVLDVVFDVVCGKGTYVRTLCADIGDRLGVGGHLLRLERRRVGRFTLDQALSMDELQDLEPHVILSRMHSISEALSELPAFVLDALSSQRVRHGTGFTAGGILQTSGQWTAGAVVRLHSSEGQLLAIGRAPWASDQVDWTTSPVAVKIEKVLM
jgi:tRNA pseudouridine55 synthase